MQINANAMSRGRLGITGLLAILLALTYLAAAVKLVSSRCEDFAAKLLVDDALYYIVPAQHLLRGEGYSFDGVVRSSGVQPLWAILSAGLTALVSDSDLLVRALSLLSAVLWIGAGVLLYLGLRSICGWTALLAFSGFVFSGFSAQLAFIGMENGLHGLLYSCLLLVGFRWFYAPKANPDLDAQSWQLPAWRWLILGVLLALFTLARIDSGLAALLVGLMVITGLVSGSRMARLRLSLRNAVLLALPGVLMVGGWLLFSKTYFDTWTPISGQIKLLYYSDRSIDFSAAPRLILSNAERVFGLAFETVTTEESVEIQQYSNVMFGNALELVGTSLNRSSVSRGQRLVLTRFWKMHQPTTLHAVELKLWISASAPSDPEATEAREGLLHLTTGCHETYPVSRWTDGEFVVETYSLEIPRSMKTGRNSIFQAVFDEDAGWLAPDRAAAPGEPAALIGQVEIR